MFVSTSIKTEPNALTAQMPSDINTTLKHADANAPTVVHATVKHKSGTGTRRAVAGVLSPLCAQPASTTTRRLANANAYLNVVQNTNYGML